MSSESHDQSIRKALTEAGEKLQNADPGPFSRKGFLHLRERIDEYIEDLIAESARIAKRAKADAISAAHVDHAAENLITSMSRRVYRHLGTIGGLLLGTALAQFVTMLSDSKFTAEGVGISASLGVVGAFLVALHIAKD